MNWRSAGNAMSILIELASMLTDFFMQQNCKVKTTIKQLLRTIYTNGKVEIASKLRNTTKKLMPV